MQYALLDCGNEKKLERFGEYVLVRPSSTALWQAQLSEQEWKACMHAQFTREGKWSGNFFKEWTLEMWDIKLKLKPTDFGHLGFFPEHALFWPKFASLCKRRTRPRILNLFAYSGGATLAFAKLGASVCHVDASKGMVDWARENALLNQMKDKPIRWIVDDVLQFLKREWKRGMRYDGIVLDPPSFGRGHKGQVFKIERDIVQLLMLCAQLLSEEPLFCLLTSHTPSLSPKALYALISSVFGSERVEAEELLIPSHRGPSLPAGNYALWTK
jgi:23S rRNA (cytosine1962-C5)-methyltransferase